MAYIVNGIAHSSIEFENEDELQLLAFENPNLFQDICNGPISICREIEMRDFGGAGRSDILLTDQDGKVILVEVKLSRNSQIRREVVAQLIDYASALKRLPSEVIIASLGFKLDEALLRDPEQKDIVDKFVSNISSGNIDLVILTDGIDPNLERILDSFRDGQIEIKVIIANKFANEEGGIIVATPVYTLINRKVQVKGAADPKSLEFQNRLNKIRDLFSGRPEKVDLGVTDVLGVGLNYRKIAIPKVPRAIHFEFQKWRNNTVHLDIENELYYDLVEIIENSCVDDADITLHKDWRAGRRFSMESKNTTEEEDVELMIRFIQKMLPLITTYCNAQ